MALLMRCEKGHPFMQPDIVVGKLPKGAPACPECRKEWEAANQEIKIDDLQRVRLKPGDVLVVRWEGAIPPSEQERVRDFLGRIFPDNEVLILTHGARLVVIGAK
jgi:hypothetical protein